MAMKKKLTSTEWREKLNADVTRSSERHTPAIIKWRNFSPKRLKPTLTCLLLNQLVIRRHTLVRRLRSC